MASDRTRRATEQLLCATGDPLDPLADVRTDDPDFVRAQCIRIGAAVLSKLPSRLPQLELALAAMTDRRLSPADRMHVEAGIAWLQGDPLRTLRIYADIAARDPDDLLALRLALSCCFFIGDSRASCEFADAALISSRSDQENFNYKLALASFAHAEIGDAAYAEWLGRAALERKPGCPYGIHAVAHALAESGESRAGSQWMREQHAHWSVASSMRTHNAWHLAMFEVDNGRLDLATHILDRNLLPAADRGPLDACDAVALLWRLVRARVDVGRRWQRLSDAFERFWKPGFWPYVDLHAAIAHGEARRPARLAALESAITECAAGTGFAADRARRLTQPALRALDAWLTGDRHRAARRLAEVPRLAEAGGSRAQLGVFVGAAA